MTASDELVSPPYVRTLDAITAPAWPNLLKASQRQQDLVKIYGDDVRHKDYHALQIMWDYGKLAFCWGEGHRDRPKHFLGAYHKTPWTCRRCKTVLFTRKVRLTSGVRRWMWYQVDVELYREHGSAILQSITAERWPRDFSDS